MMMTKKILEPIDVIIGGLLDLIKGATDTGRHSIAFCIQPQSWYQEKNILAIFQNNIKNKYVFVENLLFSDTILKQ